MKKLLSMLLMMSALLAYTGCDDDDDVVDPSLRTGQTIGNYTDVLTSAPNGWAIAFYGNTEFGGVNVLVKFDKNHKVTVANEKFASDTTAVTHYKLEQSNGIVLSFDEYCELIHYFSDPVNPDGFGSGTADGFGGDLEFRILSATPDRILLTGKKHGSRVVMTPLEDGVNWKQYLDDCATVNKVMQNGAFHMVSGTDSLTLRGNKRNRCFTYYTYDEEDSSRVTNLAPFIVTPKGLTFYDEFEFAGQKVRGYDYAPGTEEFVQTDGGSTVLSKFVPNLNEQLVEGNWFISESGLGNRAKTYWRTFRTALMNLKDGNGNDAGCYIFYAVVGTWRKHFGLTIGPVEKSEPSGVYITEAYFDYELIGTDQIRMWFNGEYDEIGNGEYFAESCKLDYAIFPFGGRGLTSAKTFKLETDNLKEPTYIKLIDQGDKNNVITLSAEEVRWPFGDIPEWYKEN